MGRRLRLWEKNILREHLKNEKLKKDSRIRRYHKRQHQVINQLEVEARLWLEHLKYQCAKWQKSEGRIPRVKIKINCTILKRTLQKCTHIQKTISNLSWAMEAASETLRPPQNVPGTCQNCILARRSSVDIGPSGDDDHALDSNADHDDDDIRNIYS